MRMRCEPYSRSLDFIESAEGRPLSFIIARPLSAKGAVLGRPHLLHCQPDASCPNSVTNVRDFRKCAESRGGARHRRSFPREALHIPPRIE